MLREHRDKLSDADAGSVEAAIADTKKALEEGGVDRINRAADALTQASHKVAEAMYKGTGPQGDSAGPGAGDGGAQSGQKTDDVIDAEYVDADEKKKN
jgi:molecular chaperone DnaK